MVGDHGGREKNGGEVVFLRPNGAEFLGLARPLAPAPVGRRRRPHQMDEPARQEERQEGAGRPADAVHVDDAALRGGSGSQGDERPGRCRDEEHIFFFCKECPFSPLMARRGESEIQPSPPIIYSKGLLSLKGEVYFNRGRI